jgi:hypothetical protein
MPLLEVSVGLTRTAQTFVFGAAFAMPVERVVVAMKTATKRNFRMVLGAEYRALMVLVMIGNLPVP